MTCYLHLKNQFFVSFLKKEIISIPKDFFKDLDNLLFDVLYKTNFVIIPFQKVKRTIKRNGYADTDSFFWNCFVVNNDFKTHITLLKGISFDSISEFRKTVDNGEWFRMSSQEKSYQNSTLDILASQKKLVNFLGKFCHEEENIQIPYKGDLYHSYHYSPKKSSYNKDGYNSKGFNEIDIHRNGTLYDEKGFANIGSTPLNTISDKYVETSFSENCLYDENGFNKIFGIHENGRVYDDDGFDYHGFNQNYIHKNGTLYNEYGYNYYGLNEEGFTINGYSHKGYLYKFDSNSGNLEIIHKFSENLDLSMLPLKKYYKS